MPTKADLTADARQYTAKYGISISTIIRIGAAVVAAVLAIQGGAPVTEVVKVHGQQYDITIQKHAG